jgi:hypothetical protein
MLSFNYVDTSKLEYFLKHTAARGCTAETLKEALAFLDHVEAHPYPAAAISMPAIPPLAEGKQGEPIPAYLRPPGDPGYSIQLEAPPTYDAQICTALAKRLLDAVEPQAVSTMPQTARLVGIAIEFATRLAHVIHWYNGVVADYLEGLRASVGSGLPGRNRVRAVGRRWLAGAAERRSDLVRAASHDACRVCGAV